MRSLLFLALCVGLTAAKGCQPPYTGHDKYLEILPELKYYEPEYTPSTPITISCKDGYLLYDTEKNEYVKNNLFKAICMFGGKFTPDISDKRFECRKPEVLCLLKLSPRLRVKPNKLAFSVRERLQFSCDSGYYISGMDRNVCGRGGKFQYPIPRCLPYCVKPSQAYLVVVDDDKSYQVGGFIDLKCSSGYRLRDGVDQTRYCQDNGSWDPKIEKDLCIKTGCRAPPTISYGSFSPQTSGDKPDSDGWYSVGAKVVYTCKTNYLLVGKEWMLCARTGLFIYRAPKCVEIRCDDEDLMISNGDYEDKEDFYSIGETITYTCSRNYKLSTRSGVRECKLNRDRKTADFETRPTCDRIECSKPRSIPNGDFTPGSGQTFYVGDRVTYECDEGYYLSGNSRAVCLLNDDKLTASFTKPPVCKEIRCDKPMRPKNGDFEDKEDSYSLGDSVTFSCDKNYYRDGPLTAKCVMDPNSETKGMFTKIPTCVEIRCLKPMKPKNGGFDPEKKSYPVGDDIEYYCVKTYRLVPANGKRTCEENDDGMTASFGSVPRCERIQCSDPAGIANGDFKPKQKEWYVGDYVEYECIPGYYLAGSSTNTCELERGGLTASFSKPPVCRQIICDLPMDLPNGEITKGQKDEYTVGDEVTYECDPEYYLSGKDTAQCQQTGEKTGEFTKAPKCIEILCKEPMGIANGEFSPKPDEVDDYSIGDSVTYRCRANYKLIGPKMAICKKSGPRSAKFTPAPRCERIECDDPMPLDNGDFDPEEPSGPFVVGTVVKYTCNRGYKFATKYTTIECELQRDRLTAKFSKLPVCERVYCMFPGEPKNGKTTVKKPRYPVDETVTFSCEPCYKLVGDTKSTCQQNGKFSRPVPTCQLRTCPKSKVPFPPNSVIYPIKPYYDCGEKVEFRCHDAYYPAGDKFTRCLPSGDFSVDEKAQCIAIKCSLPPLNKNVRVSPVKKDYFVGNEISYYCRAGYSPEDSDPDTLKSVCQKNGKFSRGSIVCVPNTCGKPPVPQYGFILNNGGSSSYPIGTEIEYQCNKWYILSVGDAFNYCGKDGQWENDAPICKPPSCQGECFGGYRKGRPCQCDHLCHTKGRNDCCSDRKKYCEPLSCAGRCGTKSPGCSCDRICSEDTYVQCCRDYYQACPGAWYLIGR